jgi:hypothetical protein
VDTRNHTSAPCRRRNFFSPALRLGKHSGQEATCKVTEEESGKALVIPRNELHSCCIARSDVRVGREVEICKAKHRPTSTPQAAAGFCNGRGKRFPADFLRRWSGKSEHAPSALTQQQTEDAGLARTARSYFPWSNMEWPRARGRCGPQYQCRLQGAAMVSDQVLRMLDEASHQQLHLYYSRARDEYAFFSPQDAAQAQARSAARQALLGTPPAVALKSSSPRA